MKKNEMMTEVKALELVMAIEEVQKNKPLFEKVQRMYEVRATKGANKKPSPKQIENKKIGETIKELFAKCENAPHTVGEMTEMLEKMEWTEPLNIQRVSRIMTNLTEEGQLERFMERKVALFRVAQQ